jgi:pilus assembly protein CpaC
MNIRISAIAAIAFGAIIGAANAAPPARPAAQQVVHPVAQHVVRPAVQQVARPVGHAAPGRAVPGNARVVSVSTQSGPVSQHMALGLDKAEIIELDGDARDVLVSNPAVVDAIVRTPRRIYLLGMKVGQANAFFFDSKGHQLLALDIRVERDTSDLAAMFHNEMPGSQIKVSALNDNIVLSGTVANASDSARAQDVAARFVGGPDKVVNMLKIAAHEQVLLKVRVAEMQREIAKQFGVNLEAAAVAGGVPIVAASTNPFGLLGRALSDSGATVGSVCTITGGQCTGGPNNVQGVLRALEQVGLLKTLAEPNLTAVSGETAKFLAGGEFPVPVSRDQLGNVVVTFKQFGVGLSFTPVVLSENRISLQISTEVSELTNEGAFVQSGGTTTDSSGNVVAVQGLTVPALAVRRAETTVELPSGGSFAIAGLLQHTTKQQIDAFPGLKDMPVLGALFRSRDYQNNETELVVLVSAYLVNPTAEANLASPTDGFVPAADAETILLGKLNATYKKAPPSVRTAGAGTVGYIVQ